jgi:vacuolar-type H+-ATPase subunit E/Vma4
MKIQPQSPAHIILAKHNKSPLSANMIENIVAAMEEYAKHIHKQTRHDISEIIPTNVDDFITQALRHQFERADNAIFRQLQRVKSNNE